MKILSKVLFLFTISFGINQLASAGDEKVYVEGGYLGIYYRESTANFQHGMSVVRVGYNANQYLSIEGMYANALSNAAFYYGSTYITAKVSSISGAYLKLKTEPSNGVSVYGKLGVAGGTVSASSSYGSAWASRRSSSYGAGIQFDSGDKLYFSAEYMSYYNNYGITVSGPSAAIGFKF